jgi:hypothetical protein
MGLDWIGLDGMGLDGIGRDRREETREGGKRKCRPSEIGKTEKKSVPEGNSTDSTKGLRYEAKLRDAVRSNE